MPELPEVETVRRGLEHHVTGRAIDSVRVLHPRAVRRHLAGPADFEAALAGRSLDAARRRGKYLWLSVGEDALLAHLGMSGQLLVGEPDRPLSPHVRIWFTFADSGPDLRFTDQRTFGHMCVVRDGAELPGPDRPHRARPARGGLRPRRPGPAAARAAHRDQARPAGPVADQRRRQHLRRRGAVASGPALGPAHRDPQRTGDQPPAGRRPRGPHRGPDGRRDELRQPVRQRQRGERLLRPVARGVRAGGPAVPRLRHAGPARPVHEPVGLQLPALPAPPPPRPLVNGRRSPDRSGGDRRKNRLLRVIRYTGLQRLLNLTRKGLGGTLETVDCAREFARVK